MSTPFLLKVKDNLYIIYDDRYDIKSLKNSSVSSVKRKLKKLGYKNLRTETVKESPIFSLVFNHKVLLESFDFNFVFDKYIQLTKESLSSSYVAFLYDGVIIKSILKV